MINPKVANAYIKYKEGTASKEQLKLLLDVIAPNVPLYGTTCTK